MSITGEPGGRGVRAGVSIADITAGMYAAFGIMTAVHARQTTGRGQFIDVSMLDGQLGILSGMIGAYLADGIVPGPLGTAYGALLPYQTFRTRTRDIAIGIGSDKLWRTFCPLLGLPHIGDDPRYVTNAARNANRASLVETLQEAFLTKTYEEWEAILLPAGIPMGAINTIDAVVAHPQVIARSGLVESARRRRDQDDGAAGAAVGDARGRARARAAARRAYGPGIAGAARAWRRRDRAAARRGCDRWTAGLKACTTPVGAGNMAQPFVGPDVVQAFRPAVEGTWGC
jgi:crotonobetainyl-CoA:carnitine CoA-transferase CaiB-like acyl-CoA transferase